MSEPVNMNELANSVLPVFKIALPETRSVCFVIDGNRAGIGTDGFDNDDDAIFMVLHCLQAVLEKIESPLRLALINPNDPEQSTFIGVTKQEGQDLDDQEGRGGSSDGGSSDGSTVGVGSSTSPGSNSN